MSERVESRHFRRPSLSVCAILAVVTLLAFSPTRVEATCGDYLDHHGQMMKHGTDSGEQLHGVQPASNPRQTPCHGPSCRKAPAQQPIPTPVVSLDFQDQWGCVASATAPSVEQSSLLAQLNQPVSSPVIAFRLDRPPKV